MFVMRLPSVWIKSRQGYVSDRGKAHEPTTLAATRPAATRPARLNTTLAVFLCSQSDCPLCFATTVLGVRSIPSSAVAIELKTTIVGIVAALIVAIGNKRANTQICVLIRKVPAVGSTLAHLIDKLYKIVYKGEKRLRHMNELKMEMPTHGVQVRKKTPSVSTEPSQKQKPSEISSSPGVRKISPHKAKSPSPGAQQPPPEPVNTNTPPPLADLQQKQNKSQRTYQHSKPPYEPQLQPNPPPYEP